MDEARGTRWLRLTPVDSWFFRDGRPHNMGEDQSSVESVFPPFAPTAAGAIRAAAARRLGWSGRGDWPDEVKRALGDGPELGPLRFTGPFLCREAREGPELLFPMPANLLGARTGEAGQWEPSTCLGPAEEAVQTDLADGPVALPIRIGGGEGARKLARGRGVWIRCSGLDRLLRGERPDAEVCVPSEKLFSLEQRVGLQLEASKRTAMEGHLYSPLHVRLAPGVSLVLGVTGLREGIELPEVLPFGGESRLAFCEPIAAPRMPAGLPSARPVERATVILLAPARLLDDDAAAWQVPGPGAPASALLPGAEGRIESVCIDRPLSIGGWDSVAHRPLPLEPFAAPGTVWFVRDLALPDAGEVRAGTRTAYGFGHAAVGSAVCF